MSVSSGWGRFTWGQAYWNRDALLATGWGAKSWNDGEWGNLADETVSLTGVSATSNIGAVADARAEEARDPMTDFRLFLVSSNCPKLTDKEIKDLTNIIQKNIL